jgi:hypothetical protein
MLRKLARATDRTETAEVLRAVRAHFIAEGLLPPNDSPGK